MLSSSLSPSAVPSISRERFRSSRTSADIASASVSPSTAGDRTNRARVRTEDRVVVTGTPRISLSVHQRSAARKRLHPDAVTAALIAEDQLLLLNRRGRACVTLHADRSAGDIGAVAGFRPT